MAQATLDTLAVGYPVDWVEDDTLRSVRLAPLAAVAHHRHLIINYVVNIWALSQSVLNNGYAMMVDDVEITWLGQQFKTFLPCPIEHGEGAKGEALRDVGLPHIPQTR